MSRLLAFGSRGPDVKEDQRLLNKMLNPSPGLDEDGIFGDMTRKAVVDFQKANWLVADGIVGPCTRCVLDGTEKFNYLVPPARLIPQPTGDTCWAAATAMLTGRSVTEVIFRSLFGGVSIAGGLYNDSDIKLADPKTKYYENTALLAKTFNLTLLAPMSWMPQALAQLLAGRGPLMMDTLWDAGSYMQGFGSPGHMRIIAGMRGDGTEDGTTMLLYDPWPPGIGKVEPVIYGPFLRGNPTSTYQIYFR